MLYIFTSRRLAIKHLTLNLCLAFACLTIAACERSDQESAANDHRIKVRTEDGRPVARINEMAWMEGVILANIFMENYIVAIDPESGSVLRKWDLTEIVEEEQPRNREHVLNGIAYDRADGRLWITGKRWRHIYQIELPNMPWPEFRRNSR